MAYFLYILYSESGNKYYVGSTGNPSKRLIFHNSIEKGFTSRCRPWKLVFAKEFLDIKSAQAAERKVKSWKSKTIIEKLIARKVIF